MKYLALLFILCVPSLLWAQESNTYFMYHLKGEVQDNSGRYLSIGDSIVVNSNEQLKDQVQLSQEAVAVFLSTEGRLAVKSELKEVEKNGVISQFLETYQFIPGMESAAVKGSALEDHLRKWVKDKEFLLLDHLILSRESLDTLLTNKAKLYLSIKGDYSRKEMITVKSDTISIYKDSLQINRSYFEDKLTLWKNQTQEKSTDLLQLRIADQTVIKHEIKQLIQLSSSFGLRKDEIFEEIIILLNDFYANPYLTNLEGWLKKHCDFEL